MIHYKTTENKNYVLVIFRTYKYEGGYTFKGYRFDKQNGQQDTTDWAAATLEKCLELTTDWADTV